MRSCRLVWRAQACATPIAINNRLLEVARNNAFTCSLPPGRPEPNASRLQRAALLCALKAGAQHHRRLCAPDAALRQRLCSGRSGAAVEAGAPPLRTPLKFAAAAGEQRRRPATATFAENPGRRRTTPRRPGLGAARAGPRSAQASSATCVGLLRLGRIGVVVGVGVQRLRGAAVRLGERARQAGCWDSDRRPRVPVCVFSRRWGVGNCLD